ncbi:MAG TPA: biotin--[acetyl-CoA-carboxylase] ligase [Chitinophagaceae bacterium]|nr:biotin--[acetyl-CoA-carboxylase] ligase [Chitinophagaceae bacterium]
MHTLVNSFMILTRVDSTNNYAMASIRDGIAKHGSAWFSYEQTHGKGRRGKTWRTEKGKNIILSIAADTRFLTVSQQFRLNIATSLACLDFFGKYGGDETKIKWPNDIFWNDRKAGGILIENIIKGNTWQWAVIGIGININQTEFNLDAVFKPVSLKQITGKEFDVIELAKELHEAILKRYEALRNNGFEKMLVEYKQKLFGLDRSVKLKRDNVVFETIIKGVSPRGKLITVDTNEREFDFDEVEWING